MKNDSEGKNVKKNRFLFFLFLWIAFLTAAALYGLSLLQTYVTDYQQAYEEAQPDHAASELLTYFRTPDCEALLHMITAWPDDEAFSDEDSRYLTLYDMLEYKQISYIHADDSTAEVPVYLIYADDYIIARATYRKKPQTQGDYGFPVWYLSELELFYPTPEDP